MAKKLRRGEKQKKASIRRNKKANRKQGGKRDDFTEDEAKMNHQLQPLGLTLREVTGDGNCLFRALADQLHGQADRYHKEIRKHTVEHMRRSKSDFEPFFVEGEDGQSFDRHLELLSEDGTYAGNDCIVAFARRYDVTVVIHQLNEPPWSINEVEKEKRRRRQLHVSYHNGDHYNSVRRIADGSVLGTPANVHVGPGGNEHDVEATVEEALRSQRGARAIWSEGGTGERIFGSQAADVARSSSSSSKKGHPMGKRNHRRNRRQRSSSGSSDNEDAQTVSNLATLSI